MHSLEWTWPQKKTTSAVQTLVIVAESWCHLAYPQHVINKTLQYLLHAFCVLPLVLYPGITGIFPVVKTHLTQTHLLCCSCVKGQLWTMTWWDSKALSRVIVGKVLGILRHGYLLAGLLVSFCIVSGFLACIFASTCLLSAPTNKCNHQLVKAAGHLMYKHLDLSLRAERKVSPILSFSPVCERNFPCTCAAQKSWLLNPSYIAITPITYAQENKIGPKPFDYFDITYSMPVIWA